MKARRLAAAIYVAPGVVPDDGVRLKCRDGPWQSRELAFLVPYRADELTCDSGYPDSTHFSHSILRTFGLRARAICFGSRNPRGDAAGSWA